MAAQSDIDGCAFVIGAPSALFILAMLILWLTGNLR